MGNGKKLTEKMVTQKKSNRYKEYLECLPVDDDPWISGKRIEVPGEKYRQHAKAKISINGEDYEATIDLSKDTSMLNTSIHGLKDMTITPVPFFPGKRHVRVSFVTSAFEPRKKNQLLEYRNITIERSFKPVHKSDSKIAAVFGKDIVESLHCVFHTVHRTQVQLFSADLRIGYSIPVRIGTSYEPVKKHLLKPFTKEHPKTATMDKPKPITTDNMGVKVLRIVDT
jgi:hypothetical protein